MTSTWKQCECGRRKTFYARRCFRCAYGEMPGRFWAKVNKSAGCWLWTGSRDGKGYGMLHLNGRGRRAHVVAFELTVGPVPSGLMLDHLCRVPACVRPEHLEPVTNRENVMRGRIPLRRLATACQRGHPFDADNTGIDKQGDRYCKACNGAARRRWVADNREHWAAYQKAWRASRRRVA